MLPRALKPMMAKPAAALPAGDDWSYEVKWDGYRAQVVKSGPSVVLRSRNLKDISAQFPAIAAAADALHAREAVVDGEVVALDAEGRPSFQALHHSATAGLTIVFYAFDLLYLDGRDLTRQPLDARRAALARVVAGAEPILLSEPLPGSPAAIERAVRRLGLEGVIAKRRRSPYEAGKRSGAWMKVKFSRRQEFVVGGYKPGGTNFDSVLAGYYQAGKLLFAGKVRTGFTPRSRAELFDAMAPHVARACPFADLPSSRTSHWGEGVTAEEMTTLKWVKPAVVIEVAFTEWTADGHLRHAAFAGMRDDKRPREVRRESATGSSAPSSRT